jgi:hypothetical protein
MNEAIGSVWIKCRAGVLCRALTIVFLFAALLVIRVRAAPEDISPARVRAAVERAIAPLQKSLVVYAERRDCFSCHHQAVSVVALQVARSRGLAIDEDAVQGAVALTVADLEGALAKYREGDGQAGGVTRAAYALWALEEGGHPADQVTAAVTGYLVRAGLERDHWTSSARRPPIEASPFTATALALRGLQYYGIQSQAGIAKERGRVARSWLAKSRPADTEDRVFRLWGLKYAGATPTENTNRDPGRGLGPARDAARERRLGPDRSAFQRRLRDRVRAGGAPPGCRSGDG